MTGTYTEDEAASPIGEADRKLVEEVAERVAAVMGTNPVEVELALLRAMANPPTPEVIGSDGKARRWVWKFRE